MARKNRIEIEIGVDSNRAVSGIKQAEGSLKRFGNFLKSSFVFTLNDVQRAVTAAFDLIRDSSELRGTETALRASLKSQGLAWDEYIAKLNEVADNQLSTASLIQSSSRAIALGIDAAKIPELLEIARGASVQLGIDFTKAFDDIVTGIGRGSPLILDNLGIVVSLTEVYKEAAGQIGTTTEEMTKQQKSAALLNAVLEKSTGIVALGEAQDKTAAAINKANAAIENFKNFLGTGFNKVLFAVISDFNLLKAGVLGIGIAFLDVAIAASGFLKTLPLIGNAIARNLPLLERQRNSLEESADEADRLRIEYEGLRRELGKVNKDLAGNAQALIDANRAAAAAITIYGKFGDEVEDAGDALDDGLNPGLETANGLLNRNREALSGVREELVRTIQQFERFAKLQGEAAAVTAAIAGGGQLVQGGTRIRFPGGSRLVGNNRSTFTNLSGGTFTVAGGVQPRVDASGNILN